MSAKLWIFKVLACTRQTLRKDVGNGMVLKCAVVVFEIRLAVGDVCGTGIACRNAMFGE